MRIVLVQNLGFFLFLLSKTVRITDRAIELPANARESESKSSVKLETFTQKKNMQLFAKNGNNLSQTFEIKNFCGTIRHLGIQWKPGLLNEHDIDSEFLITF